RAETLTEPLAQLFQNASSPLRINFTRDLDGEVVAVIAAPHRPPEGIRLLLSSRLPAARPSVWTRAHALLLHRLRKTLGALSHGLEGTALAADGAIGVTLTELTFRLAHGFARIAKFAHLVAALPLLSLLALLALLALLTLLAEPALAELLQKLVEAVTQPLLILAQVAHLVLAL